MTWLRQRRRVTRPNPLMDTYPLHAAEGRTAHLPGPYGPDPYVFGPQYQSRPEPPQGAISVWQCTACGVAWRGDCLTACWLCGKSGDQL